jgi:hypothetical protein
MDSASEGGSATTTTKTAMKTGMKMSGLLGGVALMLLAGCDLEEIGGPGADQDPRNLEGEYSWVFQRWDAGAARGFSTVELRWELPSRWSGESFRVYGRRATGGSYTLIATVTSCTQSVCRYADTNITQGQSYDYYVASLDERDGRELGTSRAVRVDVPQRPSLTTPTAPAVVSLDNAAYVRWSATGAHRYMVLAQPDGGTTYLIGETDGTSFYDNRAENGNRYNYFIAGVDAQGHVSAMSSAGRGIPRPDFHADVIYASADNLAASGFRFVSRETDDPIVAGNAGNAQWRLEVVGGVLRIQPLGQTRVTPGTFTTQLTCGPGSDANCVDINAAPADAQFNAAGVPVNVSVGNTYVMRVIGTDNRVHFGKVRVQGNTVDSQNRRLVVFDWAYQLRPEERSLNLIPLR